MRSQGKTDAVKFGQTDRQADTESHSLQGAGAASGSWSGAPWGSMTGFYRLSTGQLENE